MLQLFNKYTESLARLYFHGNYTEYVNGSDE